MTYIHNSEPNARGKPVRRSWHIARLHTRAINGWKTYCGRYIETTDTMEETPLAATCETCYRNEARDRSEDDPAVGQVDPE